MKVWVVIPALLLTAAALANGGAPAKATPTSTKYVFHPRRRPALPDAPATREQAAAALRDRPALIAAPPVRPGL